MLGYMTVLRHHGDLENPETEAYLEDEEIDLVKNRLTISTRKNGQF